MDGYSGQTIAPTASDNARTPSAPEKRTSSQPRDAGNMSTTVPPLSPAPSTPGATTPRRTAHPATSPMHLNSTPQPSNLRRASSMSMGHQQASSSPKLARKGSRPSLGGQSEELERKPTPKRSISNLIANLREAQATMEPIEEPVPLTAAQIASQHFARELYAHAQPSSEAETLVLLHDACYGHRYSRLKTTKSTLSMIVERPERIHASALGVSAAYVRLGQHHAGAKNAPHPARQEACPPPFKIRRTARSIDITSSCVTNVHGTAWMSELRGMCDAAGDRLTAGERELNRDANSSSQEKRHLHEGDLYLCSESLNAFQGALGGVADAIDAVFDSSSTTRRAFVAIRPPGHHCSADYPSGFCWLNNVHVGIEYAAQVHDLTHAAILDFDLHHGDGSQAIAWERNSKNNQKRLYPKPNSKSKLGPDIGYYSLHDINSYPCEMGDDDKVQAASLCIENAHGQSVWNVHLEEWKTEDDFWRLYDTRYRILLDKARSFLRSHTARVRSVAKMQPKAAIFISAGFDASEWEGAGMQRHKVNVPTEFYARFTRDVVDLANEEATGCAGRVISVLEGGYSDRALCSGVLSHLSGLCASPSTSVKKQELISEPSLDEMMNGLRINGVSAAHEPHYDRNWWSVANLTALEMKVNPPPPGVPGKRARTGPQPTYATPTESFAYKVVDPNKFARSISGTMREVQAPARPPTPPPPEVDWVVATQELHRLLIPTDRQTRSCTAEELGGVRTKKERQSALPVLESIGDNGIKTRQLRDRKAKPPALPYAESAHSDDLESLRSVSRSSSRRQTMHDVPSLTSEVHEVPLPLHQRRASRRLSAGSALSSTESAPFNDLDAPPLPPVPPVSAQSMRPPSVPPPAPGAAMQIKKTRAPSKSRKPPMPAASAPVSPVGVAQASNELDNLTSGLKRISLKVGSREDHEKKMQQTQQQQQEREAAAAAERSARAKRAAETRKVNAAARKAALLQTSNAGAAQGSKGAVPKPTSQPKPQQRASPSQVAAAVRTDGPSASTNRSDRMPPIHPVPPPHMPNVGDGAVSGVLKDSHAPSVTDAPFPTGYTPHTAPPAAIASMSSQADTSNYPLGYAQSQEMTLPENSEQPHGSIFTNGNDQMLPASSVGSTTPIFHSPARRVQDLPTFSSTGPIPFGMPTPPSLPSTAAPAYTDPTVNVTEHPRPQIQQQQTQNFSMTGPAVMNASRSEENGVSGSSGTESRQGGAVPELPIGLWNNTEHNVWDVPDTPREYAE